jgi:hypothetical protein
MPAETLDSERPQETFPFMQLPPELRVMVYKLALQDVVDPILSADSGDAKEPKQFHGALALLHTSQIVRRESCRAVIPIARAHCKSLLDARRRTMELRKDLRLTHTNQRALHQLHDQHGKLVRQHDCIGAAVEALTRVYCSRSEILQARDGTPGWEPLFRSIVSRRKQ